MTNLTEIAQIVQKIVEDWADGCEHTHNEPEDCEVCTEAMIVKVGLEVRDYLKAKRELDYG